MGATIPLPSKGPIQVDLNNPQNVAISIATLPSNVTPNVQEWNVQFERQIGESMSWSLAYVGNKGTHLTTYYNYNRQQYNDRRRSAATTTRLAANFPAFGCDQHSGDDRKLHFYNSLQDQRLKP